MQVTPLPLKPWLQEQVKLPPVLLHVAFWWQLEAPVLHSFMSENKSLIDNFRLSKSSLYSRYFAEACNGCRTHLRDVTPGQHSNVAEVASCWPQCTIWPAQESNQRLLALIAMLLISTKTDRFFTLLYGAETVTSFRINLCTEKPNGFPEQLSHQIES